MKATLEFNLPEETAEHLRAVHADASWCALYEVDSRLRNLLKYGISKDSSYEKELSEIRKEVNEIIYLMEEG